MRDELLSALVEVLSRRRAIVAVAESLTGGLLALDLTRTPGSGSAFAGGVVAYHGTAKRRLLDVPDGPVISARCARAMAAGVADLFGADVALATTGVAGPATQEGHPVGTVWIGWWVEGDVGAERHLLPHPDPEQVRRAAVDTAIETLAVQLLPGLHPRATFL